MENVPFRKSARPRQVQKALLGKKQEHDHSEWLPRKCARAVKVVQGQRAERGQPMDRPALAESLDQAIDFCKQMELTYRKILLMPLEEFQRVEASQRAR